MADRHRIDRTAVARSQSGKRGVSTLLLSAIADVLTCPPSGFIEVGAPQLAALFGRASGISDQEFRK